jgi:EthD domain
MTATVDPAAKQMARFVVMYDTPSDVDAFERHYNDVHIPLAKQYPGLRRYTRSHEPAAVIGEPCYMVVMLDWDDTAALGSRARVRDRPAHRRGCHGEPGPLRDLPRHDPAARRGLMRTPPLREGARVVDGG